MNSGIRATDLYAFRVVLVALLLGSIGLQRLVPCDDFSSACDGEQTSHVIEVVGSVTHPCESDHAPHQRDAEHSCLCACHVNAVVRLSLPTQFQPVADSAIKPYRRNQTCGMVPPVDHIPIS